MYYYEVLVECYSFAKFIYVSIPERFLDYFILSSPWATYGRFCRILEIHCVAYFAMYCTVES